MRARRSAAVEALDLKDVLLHAVTLLVEAKLPRYIGAGTRRVAAAILIAAVPSSGKSTNPEGLPIEVFDGLAGLARTVRSSTKTLP
jgi:hypothetical protein